MIFLTVLPFLGTEVGAGGLIRLDFLICCVGNITAVFCGDFIEHWVALEECVFAIFFVIGTEGKNTQHKNTIKINDIIKVFSSYDSEEI